MEALLNQLLQIILALITLISSYMVTTGAITSTTNTAANTQQQATVATNTNTTTNTATGDTTNTATAPTAPTSVSGGTTTGTSGVAVAGNSSTGTSATDTTTSGATGSSVAVAGVSSVSVTGGGGSNTTFGTGPMQIGINDTWTIYGGIYSGGLTWSSALVSHLNSVPYNAFRFMNFNGNGAQIPGGGADETWATRVPSGQIEYPGQGVRISYEAQIALCNTAKVDCWISVPAKTDQDAAFAQNLAQLVYDNLDPSLKVYIEWSNESWNDGGYSAQYAASRARALGFTADENEDYVMAGVYTPCAGAQLWSGFESVFTGADRNRLVTVLAGQYSGGSDTWLTEFHFENLADPKCNPNGLMPDAYAVAPYFDGTVGGAQSVASGFPNLRAAVPAEVALVTYEGGTWEAYDYDGYYTYLDLLSEYFSLFMAYNLNQPTYGVATEGLGDTERLRAIRDWQAANGG